jgi:uncharacterized membrane protein YhaH (DUF805 family)
LTGVETPVIVLAVLLYVRAGMFAAFQKEQLLLGFKGRIGRKSYWFATAAVPLIAILLFVIFDPFDLDTVLSGDLEQLQRDPVLLTMLLTIAGLGLWMLAAVNAKRLHDRDRTAWWLMAPGVLMVAGLVSSQWAAPKLVLAICAAAALITLPVTIWLIVELGFHPGSSEANRFGPEPSDIPSSFNLRKIDRQEVAVAAIRGFFMSPFGFLIVLSLKLIEFLLTPVRRRHTLFGFAGRIRRRDFWGLTFLAFVLAIAFDVLVIKAAAFLSGSDYQKLDSNPAIKPVHLAIIGLMVWALAAIGGKRLHDRDHSAWWVAVLSPLLIVILLPLLGPVPRLEAVLNVLLVLCLPFALWLIVQLGFLKGTPGPNRFGLDPNVTAAHQ